MNDPYNPTGATTLLSQHFGTLGALLGYVSAEAATADLFERLLWPQRSWNTFDARNAVLTGLFMPMSGPLYKAALQTLSDMYEHGLFQGVRQGHMLGTAFFRDSKLPYTAWLDGEPVERDYCRNNLWLRAVGQVAIPTTILAPVATTTTDEKAGGTLTTTTKRPVRARTALHHIKLEQKTASHDPAAVVVNHETGPPTLTTYAYALLSEATALLVGGSVAAYWRTWLALLWFVPLALKLLAVYLSLPREGLAASASPATQPQSTDRASTAIKTYEIRDPRHGIVLLSGTDSTVLQFFRHYGHPGRDDRHREVALLGVVAALGLAFPISLVCAVLWMAPGVQRVWLAYQVYVAAAMVVYRFAGGERWAGTERAVAEGWEGCRMRGAVERVELRGGGGRDAVVATLEARYFDNLREAQEEAEGVLGGRSGM